jgi:hypothetical protein
MFVQQLAHQQTPLQPPLIEIDKSLRLLRRGQDELSGFLRLVVLPQPLHAGKDVAGLTLRGHRYGVEERFCIARLLQDRSARTGDYKVVATEAFGGAQAGGGVAGVKAGLHAHFVIGGGQHAAEHLKYLFLDLCAAVVVAPGVLDQRCSSVAVALGEQDPGEHVAPLGG